MARLELHLQHGFDGDDVVVTVNGEELLHQAGVRSNPALGLAMHEAFDVADGPLALDVTVPTRGLACHHELEGGDLHVGIAIQGGALRVMARQKRFGYG